MSKQPFVFHAGEYLEDELRERGWTTRECAQRMGSSELDVCELALDLFIACAHAPPGHAATGVHLSRSIAEGLEKALGISADTWMNLDKAYHDGLAAGGQPHP